MTRTIDPDAALAKIRVCVDALNGGTLSFIERVDAADQLRDAVQALDTWLSDGGTLPDVWQRQGAVA